MLYANHQRLLSVFKKVNLKICSLTDGRRFLRAETVNKFQVLNLGLQRLTLSLFWEWSAEAESSVSGMASLFPFEFL